MLKYTVKVLGKDTHYWCLLESDAMLENYSPGMFLYTEDEYCRWFPMHMIEYINCGSHKGWSE